MSLFPISRGVGIYVANGGTVNGSARLGASNSYNSQVFIQRGNGTGVTGTVDAGLVSTPTRAPSHRRRPPSSARRCRPASRSKASALGAGTAVTLTTPPNTTSEGVVLYGDGNFVNTGRVEPISTDGFGRRPSSWRRSSTTTSRRSPTADCRAPARSWRFHCPTPARRQTSSPSTSARHSTASPIRVGSTATYGWSLRFAPRVLVLVRPTRDDAAATALLRWTFGLSEAEAEIAARLAAGESRADIAEGRGVAIGTIRTQLKAIFSKLGINREIELAARIAPSCTDNGWRAGLCAGRSATQRACSPPGQRPGLVSTQLNRSLIRRRAALVEASSRRTAPHPSFAMPFRRARWLPRISGSIPCDRL